MRALLSIPSLRHLMPWLVASFLLAFSVTSHAKLIDDDKILLAHTSHNFDTTLARVKQQLVAKDFQIAHVQRCDNGLKKMGYDVNKYQVVFFGRIDEVRELTTKHAELAPFLPFKILIYIEGDKTAISVMNPEMLKPMVTDEVLVAKLEQWKQEFVAVLEQSSESSL